MPDYRSLPSVNELAGHEDLQRYPQKLRVEAARQAIDQARELLEKGQEVAIEPLAMMAAANLKLGSLRSVQNMSGVILHTGLGRAPLPVAGFAIGYQNLEFDLESGKRGSRQVHVKKLLCDLTGAEDAIVVNNGAAAVLLALSALCTRKEVLLSRGQSVEIGGGFRMPDVIRTSGCKLVDVGTTNKTRIQDYVDAITPKTAAILQCHPSNFEIKGFVESPTTAELALAAKEKGVLFINDQGNGALLDFKEFGVQGVETLPQSVAAGADITIGSGDKLLGGPQCGIVLGRKELVEKMAKHPLARALRIDKTNLSILHATLQFYAFEDYDSIPLIRYLKTPAEDVRALCETLAPEGAEILESTTEIGSGAAPGQGVKSFAIVLETKKPDQLLKALRTYGYVGRIHKGKVWLVPRAARDYFGGLGIQDPEFRAEFNENVRGIIADCWKKWR